MRAQLMQKLQGMVATNLPSITLYYVDSVWVYNTANFEGWPTPPSTMDWPGGMFNMTALASLFSLSAQTMSSTSSATSTFAGAGVSTGYIVGAVVVVIIVIAAAVMMRKRGKSTTSPEANTK